MDDNNKLVVANRPYEVATVDELGDLHGELAATLKKMMMKGEVVIDKEGLPVATTPSPALLNIVRQFLKDNNISAKPVKNSDLGDLIDDLPY